MLWYSLEAPQRGASNEYPQHMFSWRNKKKYQYFWIEKSALTSAMVDSLLQFFNVILKNLSTQCGN